MKCTMILTENKGERRQIEIERKHKDLSQLAQEFRSHESWEAADVFDSKSLSEYEVFVDHILVDRFKQEVLRIA